MTSWERIVIVVAGAVTIVAVMFLIPKEDADTRTAFLAGLLTVVSIVLTAKYGSKDKPGGKEDDQYDDE